MEELLIFGGIVLLLRRTAMNHTRSSRAELRDYFFSLILSESQTISLIIFFLIRFPIIRGYMRKIVK